MTPTLSPLVYHELVETACSTLGLSMPAILEKYGNMPLCIMEYRECDERDTIVELWFDEARITLSCNFGEDDTCCTAFLFFDDREEINGLINCMNACYTYDFIHCCWLLPNCCLRIRTSENEVFIILRKYTANQ